MKKFALLGSAVALGSIVAVGTAHGQQLPPPPPPPGGGPTSTPTLVPSPVPTATPVPLTLSVSLAGKVKAGKAEKVAIRTLPNANVFVTVRFPNNQTNAVTGAANPQGNLTLEYIQPKGVTRGRNHRAAVAVKVTLGGQAKASVKHYTIQ
jgi:hypothetical protein